MRRVDGCSFAAGTDMALRIPVTSFAGDTAVQKWQPTVAVDSPRIATLYTAHMTPQAAALHGQGRRHLRHPSRARLQIKATRACLQRNARSTSIFLEFG